jgi:Ca-activated chloride channel homolog
MSFDAPFRLVLGAIAVVLFLLWYRRAEARSDAQALRYSNLAFFERAAAPRRWTGALLRWSWTAALALLAIAAAGPHLTLPLPASNGSVFICVDTSGSMASTDVTPTRSSAAAAAARAFVTQAPAGIKIGLIAFASNAELVAPLSSDKNTTLAAVDQLPAPNGATAIGDALQLAASQFPPSGHRVVVLITDGVNNTGTDPQEMAQYLGAHHIPVYTIGIGTPNGDVIGGEQTTIDEGALQSYAEVSGGAYARAENADELRAALARLGRETTIERQSVPAALGFAYAGGVILIVTVLAGLGLGKYP